jgi:hypothetical protein
VSDPDLYRRLAALEKWRDQMASVELSRFVGARYTSNAGQSIPNNSFTVVNFEDVDYDPLSLVTTGAGWVFTCPVDGYYLVTATVTWASTTAWDPAEDAQIEVFKNGVSVGMLARRDGYPAATALAVSLSGADVIACSTGDTLDVRAFQNTGAALALLNDSLYNHVSVTRIG